MIPLIRLPWATHRKSRKQLRALNWPAREALHYCARLLEVVRETEYLVKHLVTPQLPRLAGQLNAYTALRADDAADELTRIMDRVKLLIPVTIEKAQQLAAEMLERVQLLHVERFAEAYEGVLAINPFAGSEPWLGDMMSLRAKQNVDLIRSLPEDMLFDVEATISREILAGTHTREIAALIQARFDVAESRALTIANDQVGKWFGSLNKLRQTDAGVTEYTWLTAGDEHVRPAHKELNGKRRKWGEGLEPGQAIRCRCQAIPVIPEYEGEQ